MRKLKLFLSMLMLIAFSVGNVWAATADVTYDFTGSDWSVSNGALTNGTVSFTGEGSSFKMNTGYFMLGKSGAVLNFPTYSSAVEKIVVTGRSGASGSTKMNIYVGETAVSTETTGSTGTNTYEIASASQAAGTTYTLKVTSNHNAQITKIEVFYAGGTPTCATPTFDPEDGETFTDDIDVEIASTTDGATIYYTIDGNDPTTSSDVYSTALNFTETTTLKAMAVKEGSNNSEIATATYTKVAPFDGTILEITKDDFVASYASNNGDHEKDGVTYYTNQVCLSSSSIQFQKSNGLLYNKTDLGEIAKIEITKTGDNNLLVYSGTTENPTTGEVTGSASGSVTTYTFASGKGFFAIKCNSTALSQVTPIKIYYVYSAPAVATPTISGETPFVTTTTVTLGCTTDGASIYYTTDGTDPSSSSTLYSDPFELNAGATVKAIAIKGNDESAIASKGFEKVTSYTTLAAIYDKAVEVSSTATDIYVTFDSWKISAKTNNNAFLTDGTNGAVIYGNGHGFNAGDVLTGTVACKVQLYKGFAELTSLNSATPGLTVTPGSVGDPVVKTWDQLSAVNTGALVKLENLTYDGSSLSDGVNTIPTYTTFYTATFEAGKSYNLTGVYQYYDTDGQILPRSAADVEEIVETFTVTYDNAPENGTLTIKNGDDVVTSGSAVNEGTVLTIVTSPAEDYKLDGVTVNGSAYAESTLTLTENVTIAATFVVNEAPLVTTYILSEIGTETSHLNGEHVGDKVNLPLTAATCSKTFVGWDADEDCDHAPTYAPGEEITLAANNKFYAVYADAHVVTPTDHALGSLTVGGTSGNTASEGYTYTSNKTNDKAGYTQDSGTKDADIVHLQIKAESQIISEEPSAIIVTAHLGAGADRDELTYPVNAVLVDAEGNNVGDPVVLTNSIPDKNGDDFSANLPTANYANVRGVKISHMKEDGWNIRYYSMSFKYQTGGTTYDNYSTDCQAAVATPTFSPEAGTYTSAQTVTISTETADATIYYTTNGDEPTSSSTLYEGAISVGENMTIKAIAVKDGMANSAVATAEYTINLPLSTMDQIFAAATAAGSTATDVNITFGNWVVSGVSTNGKNVFVTDGTKGFIIFDNGGEMGFAVGDVLSGTVACKVQLYNGAAELTTLSSTTEGLNVATGGTVTPAVKAISALSGINTGAAVTINSVQFDGEYLSDGANSIKPYNSLFAYEALESGKYYNVTGIYQQFGSTKELLPRSAEDIEEVDLADPEISYTPASATIELGESLPGTTFANPHELAISYSSNNEAVATVSNAGVIALGSATGTAVITASFAGDATYAAANVTYTITVNPASVSENVVILAVYDTKYYAMSTTHITSSNAFTAIEIEYDGSQVTVASEADKAAIQWTKKTSGENHTFQTKDEDHKYMKGTTSGAAMSLDANVCNWSWDDTNEYFYIGSRSFFFQNGVGFKNFATSNLNKSGYSGKAQVIAIAAENIVITSKVSAELAYDPESDEITQGDAWSAPSLVNPHSVTITSYNSDNEAVATVTDGGVIALAGGIGTAVITAHFDGDASYLEGDAVYTITVNAPAPTPSGTSYVKVTSTADITADGEYLLVNENALKAFNGNLETLDAEGNTVDVVISGGKIAGTSAIDAAIFTIDASNGNLRSHSGHYVGVGGYSNGLAQSDEAGTYANVFAINASENVDITITFTGGDMHLLYNTANRFRYYKAENQTNKAIQLYKKESSTPEPAYTTVRSGLDCGRHYTVCLENNVTAVKGATFWSLRYKNEASKVAYLELETVIEAGKPYIFQATADKLEVVYGEEVTGAPVANGALVGTFEDLDADDLNGISGTVYMLFNNELRPIGANNHLDAHRAYVLYDLLEEEPAQGFAPGKKVKRMPMQSQTTTDCELINAAEAPAKMMINGQLFILRGEKMYDTTGRLVK